MATYPVYPATTFTQAVELTIFASNQLHDVINGDALTTVETENGDVPTLRKALVDNFYFKTPINWVEGESATVFNQLYYFDGTLATSGWYYAPQATLDNPIAMGSTPIDDDNWRLYQTATQSIPAQVYPWSMEIIEEVNSVAPPYEFDSAIVTLNGVVLVPSKDYTITNSVITFTHPLEVSDDPDVTNILFCYLGKVEEGNAETNYVTYANLAKDAGASLVGTSSGYTVQQELDNNAAATSTLSQNLGSSENGKGGQLVAAKYPEDIIGTVQGYIDTRESVALNAFMVGAETDAQKFAALQTALEYCNTNFCDLHVYGLTVPVLNTAYINHRHYSIIGHNGAVFDCTQCVDTYAFDFVEESTSTGTIWNSLTNVVRGFKFLGNSTGRFLNLHNDDPGKVPAFHMAQCLVTGFDTGVRFGSNNWAAKFDTVFFRGNTYDIRNDRETDAGELNLFINCIFGASKAALYDVKGAATFEFAFCRFDYGGPVILADSGVGKGDIRFTGCHFERNTNVTTPDFNITAGADWYKITATNCIWALNGASRQLGYMNSTDRRARFEIRDCFFNNYAASGEDNSNVEFFTVAGSATVKASGNVVKSGTRNTGVIFSRGSRISPSMNVAAVTAGTVQVNGGGTTGSSTDYPSTNIQFDTALLLTGQKAVWVQVPVVPGEDIQISGWVKRSSLGYTPNLRSFDYFGNRVELQSFSVSETLGEWARFILLYTVPKYCTSVQLHLGFDSSVVKATDTCILHSWMIERF